MFKFEKCSAPMLGICQKKYDAAICTLLIFELQRKKLLNIIFVRNKREKLLAQMPPLK